MNEEPTIDRTVQNLVTVLDKNVLRELVRSSRFDGSVVGEAEASLRLQKSTGFEEATSDSRAKLRVALSEWVEAVADWLHRTSSH
jgi:hypothetical protein